MLNISLQGLTLLIALVSLGLQYTWHDKRTTAHKIVLQILVGLLIISGVTSTWATWLNERQTAAIKANLEKILEEVAPLREATENLARATVAKTEARYEKPVRHLNEHSGQQLVNQLRSLDVSRISITAVLGDQEAFAFANEVKSYLERQGIAVDGVNQAIYAQPVRDQRLIKRENGDYEIVIGGI